MFKKKPKQKPKQKLNIKFRLTIMLCISIVMLGVLNITNDIPQFMKDKSAFSLNYDFKPLDIKVKAGEYSIFLNEGILTNGENSVHNFFDNVEIRVSKIVNTLTHKK